MPEAKYSGSPTGSGATPGKHSDSYLSSTGEDSDFTKKSSYRGNMSVGRNETATVVGNQPQVNKTTAPEAFAHRPLNG